MRNKCAIHSFACTLTVQHRRSDIRRFLQATLLPRITRQFDKGVFSLKELSSHLYEFVTGFFLQSPNVAKSASPQPCVSRSIPPLFAHLLCGDE